MEVWTDAERARQRRNLIELEEYAYIKSALEKGWVTDSSGRDADIVKIRSDSKGMIRISLNQDFAVSADRAKLAGALVQGLSASYAPIYYQAVGILPIRMHPIDSATTGTTPTS